MVMEEQREATMEAPPSPQSVGREFVRQYYTLLNKSPDCLHRFYGPDSSFLHGGLDPSNCETAPVFGQKQIHNKVQQLNFRDCHAKILQVDSLATIGNGVVIQVTGELSNAGQPMRRFSQTFILAVKAAKSYYVYNDIFRYQDEIISDEEYSGEEHSEIENSTPERPILNDSQPVLGQPVVSAPILTTYYGGAVQAVAAPAPVQPVQTAPVVAAHQQPIPQQIVQSTQAVTLNGHPEDLTALTGQSLSGHLPAVSRHFVPQQVVEPLNHAVAQPVEEARHEVVATSVAATDAKTGFVAVDDINVEPEIPQESASVEPKTYANRLKSTTSAQPSQTIYQQPISTFGSQSAAPNASVNRGGAAPSSGGLGNGPTRPFRGGPFPSSRNNGQPNRGPRVNEDGDRRRSQSFGQANDSNQLFLGNLPHAATEEQLRDIFSEFGNILEFKIFKTQGGPAKLSQGGRAPPNYAFITYENQQHVHACLSAKPIFYPKNDSNGTQLNIEMKRYGGGNNGVRLGGDNGAAGGGRIGGGRGNDNQRRPGNGAGGNRGGPGGPQGGGGGNGGPGDRNRNQGDRYNRGGGGPGNRGSNNYTRR